MIDCNKVHFQLGGGRVRVWGDPGAVSPEFQTSSSRKAARWGLIAVLFLLLVVSAGTQGSRGAGVQGSKGAGEQSPTSNLQSPISISYAYDAAGRLVSANYSSGAGIAYSYDAAGNLLGVSAEAGRGVYLPLVLH